MTETRRSVFADVSPSARPPAPLIQALFAFPLLVSLAPAMQTSVPLSFESAEALENYVLSDDEAQISKALASALNTRGADSLIRAAMMVGPAQASQLAAILPDPGYRQGYRNLARYLDLYAPCHKQIDPKAEGWWTNYPDPPTSQHCTEAVKLLFSALLWNQVHYCSRLASGAENSKLPVVSGKQPPYRLDEPPVATAWLLPDALYAFADAAIKFNFSRTLQRRSASAPERVRGAMLDAAAELDRPEPNREQVALAVAKILIRRYEQSHLNHIDRL